MIAVGLVRAVVVGTTRLVVATGGPLLTVVASGCTLGGAGVLVAGASLVVVRALGAVRLVVVASGS